MKLDLQFASIRDQGRLFRQRRASPAELVQIYLDRIRKYDGRLNAFIEVFDDRALVDAARATEELANGVDRGPLHGIPFAVKDIFAIQGRLPTAGSNVGGFRLDASEATVIRRLRDAGAVLLGTLNTHELQFGITRRFPFGTPRNPWDTSRATGGSSAGSASAVAAGLCTFSLGGDTGASIRTPAALCGVTGMRPTWSRVSRHGAMSAHPGLDCVGPLGRYVEDVALVLKAIAGHDENDPTSSERLVGNYAEHLAEDDAQGLVGAVMQMLDPTRLDADVTARVGEALDILRQSTTVQPTSLPLISKYPAVFPTIVFSEVATRYRSVLLDSQPNLDSNTRAALLAGAALPAISVIRARQAASLVAKQVLDVLGSYELLVGATTQRTAGRIPDYSNGTSPDDPVQGLNGRQGSEGQMERRSFSLAGVPALTVPCGLDRNGLPVGLHIAGRPFEEGRVLRAASLVERHFEWQPPPGFS